MAISELDQQWPTIVNEPNPVAAELVDGLLTASIGCDPTDIRRELDHAAALLGLGRCLDEVLLPAMRQIGTWWARGCFDIETERLTSEIVRAWLDARALQAPEPGPAAVLVLACGPAERHSIGLEALGVLLRHRGRSCRMLGPRTSIRSITAAVAANQPSGVIVVSHNPTGRLAATQALQAVAATTPHLFFAGASFATAPLRRDVPGIYLGVSIQDACTRIIDRCTDGV